VGLENYPSRLRTQTFLKYWGPVILMMMMMFIGSTDWFSSEHTSRFIGPFLRWFHPDITGEAIRQVQLAVRKTAHVIEYGMLTILLLRALRRNIAAEKWSWKLACMAACISCLYAMSDEWHQSYVASRGASAGDVLIDTTGALLGVTAFHFFVSRRNRKQVLP
jgi:VanZ family protein